jgi:hypothetical protein
MLELVANVGRNVFLDTLDVFGVEGLVELDVLVAVEDCVFELWRSEVSEAVLGEGGGGAYGGDFIVRSFFGGLDLGLFDGAFAGDGLFALGAVVVFGSRRWVSDVCWVRGSMCYLE